MHQESKSDQTMRLVTEYVSIEYSDLDAVMCAPSIDTKKVKHRLKSFNTRYYSYTILYHDIV